MTDVQGRCPACGGASLFLGSGGYVTCSRLDCPAPGEADDLLHGRDSVYAIGQALGGGRVARLIAYALASHEHSLADVRRMTDAQLRAIPGIGDESLAHIRAAIPAPMPDKQAASIDWQAIVRERERDLKKVDMARYLAEQELARLRAGEEPGWDPATVPTPGQWITRWNAASTEERLEVARQVIEDRARAAHCFEMAHEKRLARSEPPTIGTARIALDVQPGIADGITSGEDADHKVLLPVVEMTGAASLPLGDRVDQGFVLVGDLQSKVLIGGRRLAVSADKPVVVEPFGPGIPGGAVTLTLNCERVTIDGKEVGDVR